jgi:hypothetical protein
VAVVNDVFYVFGVGSNWPGGVVVEQYTPIGYGTSDPSYVLEHVPPEISILSPLNQTYNDSNIPLNFTVNKVVSWASYSLDSQQNVTITGNTTIANLTNGMHSLIIYANDTYSNIGSQASNFTVLKSQIEKSSMSITILTVAVPVAIIGLGVGLLVYRRHRKTGKSNQSPFPKQVYMVYTYMF